MDIRSNPRVSLPGADNGAEMGLTQVLDIQPGAYAVTTTAPIAVVDGESQSITAQALPVLPEAPREVRFEAARVSVAALTHAPARVTLSRLGD